MNITITLSEEDQSLQAEILKVLLTPKSDKSDKSDETPKAAEKPTTQPAQKPTEQPTPKPYPMAGGEETPAPPDPSDPSDPSDSSDKAATPSDSSALSMADLRKSVNAISRKKGLNWLYSWLGDLGVKSITEIPTDRLEEAHSKLQNYA